MLNEIRRKRSSATEEGRQKREISGETEEEGLRFSENGDVTKQPTLRMESSRFVIWPLGPTLSLLYLFRYTLPFKQCDYY